MNLFLRVVSKVCYKTKQNKTKRNETKQNKTKQSKSKRNEKQKHHTNLNVLLIYGNTFTQTGNALDRLYQRNLTCSADTILV